MKVFSILFMLFCNIMNKRILNMSRFCKALNCKFSF